VQGSGAHREHISRLGPHHPLEWRIGELALTQNGVIALWQLLELGLTASAVRKRVAAGRLRRLHAGVYAAGHAPLSLDGRYMAAVLACGLDAALSHRSAAHKCGMRPSSRAFEHDRRRDQRLMLAGYRVARFSRRQVLEDPASVLATLTALLSDAGPVCAKGPGGGAMVVQAPDESPLRPRSPAS